MIVVIIAGGSGTRLWPLSTPEYPKHLLKLGNETSSLLQTTYVRAKKLTDQVYIIPEQSHVDEVREQLDVLDDQHLIVEPGRRGTANCIVSGLVRLSQTINYDEPIAFIHSDHFIRDERGFIHSFNVAMEVASNEKKIVLVGVEPSYPATGFGYIEKNDILENTALVYKAISFKEKPDFNTARGYLISGNFLWNCGYFVGTLNTFIDRMTKYAPNLLSRYNQLSNASPESFNTIYLNYPNEAIDYALIEKVPDLLVVPASFDWMDLGSFVDLASAVESDELGNFIVGDVVIENVEHSYIENLENKPVAVIGLDNCVVVNTKDGVLVARKDLSQKVGDISKQINSRGKS